MAREEEGRECTIQDVCALYLSCVSLLVQLGTEGDGRARNQEPGTWSLEPETRSWEPGEDRLQYLQHRVNLQ